VVPIDAASPLMLFSDKQGRHVGWHLSAKSARRRKSAVGRDDAIVAAVSPDGSRVAFSRPAIRAPIIGGFRREGGPTVLSQCTSFSPDARLLATSGPDEPIRVWEVTTGREVLRLGGCGDSHHAVAFSPDGTRPAVGADGATILVWDVAHRGYDCSRATDDQLWDDLGSGDVRRAYRTQCALSRDPARAVPLLRARLTARTTDGEDRFCQCIAALDSPHFAERERATKELARMDVGGGLRSVIADAPSEETRRRAAMALDRIRASGGAPDWARRVRVVAVLEHAGTPEARQLLAELADGDPDAALTLEARATLTHLDRRLNR
jgi:hypothetical protein